MTQDELLQVGADLTRLCPDRYGRGWQAELARQLDVHPNTVGRWTSGAQSVSRANELAIQHLLLREQLAQ